MDKEIFTLLGIFFMAWSYGIYIWSIFKGTTRPHPFSWFIWGLVTAIAFFAQLNDQAGSASLITGLSAIITFTIAAFGVWKRHEIVITKGDWIILFSTLLSIPLWMITQTPLWSVILITIIDLAGFYPTFRKTWNNPYQESAFSHSLSALKHFFTIMAISHYSVVTTLFPLCLLIAVVFFVLMLFYRKKVLSHVPA